jgi:hypothetical protein
MVGTRCEVTAFSQHLCPGTLELDGRPGDPKRSPVSSKEVGNVFDSQPLVREHPPRRTRPSPRGQHPWMLSNKLLDLKLVRTAIQQIFEFSNRRHRPRSAIYVGIAHGKVVEEVVARSCAEFKAHSGQAPDLQSGNEADLLLIARPHKLCPLWTAGTHGPTLCHGRNQV